MTPEQIDQFARAIGEVYDGSADPNETPNNYSHALAAVEVIRPLIDAAIAAEREVCAKLVEQCATDNYLDLTVGDLDRLASAIRARGQT